ncbi:uncharacterized protein LOC128275185 [Anopheles cruzii]|uniref:uncharacterized protein LOC128275185 n=1 Tax=Anopheles cruzii TaxID=68878 RepID=UPI0022EC8593|nr:uncharacterized protein LOC128275185 [Anopheles cruzii]
MEAPQQSPKASGTGDPEGKDGIEQVKNVVPQLPQYLHTVVEKLASRDGFTMGKFSVVFDLGSNKGDGFAGEIFKAIVTESVRKSEYLCKIPPLDEVRRVQFHAMITFARETLVYEKFLPMIYKYQREKGLTSPGEGFFHAPRCYHAHCDEAAQESVIVMEDLRLRDFQMWNKHNPIDYDHAKLFMEHIGRLHAISLAMKRDRPEEFEPFKLPNPFDKLSVEGDRFDNSLLSQFQVVLDALDERDTIEQTKMEQLKLNVFKEQQRCENAALAEPYAVIIHGDCWINNMMFRYKDGKADEIILFDWQVMRYVSPVLDLVYFIFCCTDEDFRRKHYDEMIDIYYRSLSVTLEKLQHAADELFPRDALDEHLRLFGRYGLLRGMFLVPIMCTEADEFPNMEEMARRLLIVIVLLL